MSNPARRLLTLVLLSLLAVAAIPAVAAATNTAAQVEDTGPAIVIDDEQHEEATPAWTYRFLIPATLVLVVLVVVVTVVQYFVKVVRARYRVVQ